MHIEVLCTGDELLTGLTADTNSPFFMGRLLDLLGERVVRAQTVGDVREDIVDALRTLSARCDAVLVCGGLGPTADDLTAECAAIAGGTRLVQSEEALQHVRERLSRRNVAFTENNAKQALVPEGAEVVMNPVGSAPMFVQRIGRCTLFYLPGVPVEYRHLVEREVLPRLMAMLAAGGRTVHRRMRLLKTFGLPESHLDAKVAPLFARHPHVVFGFRTAAPENHLKLLAEAESAAAAEAVLEAAERECLEVLGEWVFGRDFETLAGNLGAALAARGQTVAVAESCTGGLLAELLTRTPGCSRYFLGSAVAYAAPLKTRWALVEPGLIERHGVVSEPVAVALAQGARAVAGATFGVGITGIAGPEGGTEELPVGTVFLAVEDPDEGQVVRLHFGGDRDRVRRFAAHSALDMLRRRVLKRRG